MEEPVFIEGYLKNNTNGTISFYDDINDTEASMYIPIKEAFIEKNIRPPEICILQDSKIYQNISKNIDKDCFLRSMSLLFNHGNSSNEFVNAISWLRNNRDGFAKIKILYNKLNEDEMPTIDYGVSLITKDASVDVEIEELGRDIKPKKKSEILKDRQLQLEQATLDKELSDYIKSLFKNTFIGYEY